MMTNNKAARWFGVCFLLTFLSYGTGSGLIDGLVSTPDFLAQVYSQQAVLVIGAGLIAIVHTIFNIALPVIMLPVLRPYDNYLPYGYLAAAIVSTVILAVGALCLLLLVPLSNAAAQAGPADVTHLGITGELIIKGGFYAYHLGMVLWSLGGLMFVSVLYKSLLVPRWMSIWGLFGYGVLITGSTVELFNHNPVIEILSVIPGGLFEVTLSLWLIVKGFSDNARLP